MTQQYSLWVANVVIPVAAFAANVILRKKNGLPYTIGADVILLLLIFDTMVIISSSDFAPLIRDDSIRKDIVTIFAGLLWVGLVAWLSAVLYVEGKLTAMFDVESRKYQGHWTAIWLGCGWLVVSALIAGHVLAFVLKT